jgi:hypothetical protein
MRREIIPLKDKIKPNMAMASATVKWLDAVGDQYSIPRQGILHLILKGVMLHEQAKPGTAAKLIKAATIASNLVLPTPTEKPAKKVAPKKAAPAPVTVKRGRPPQQAAPPVPMVQPEVAGEAPPVPVRVAPEPLADVEDSFVDPGDQEGMAAAIAAENRRVLARRQQAGRDLPPAPASVINAALATQPRRPPHLDALEAENELETAATARGAVYVGKTADGVDTFRMPTEDVIERRGAGEKQPRVPLNRGSNPKSSQNPRFKPAPKM